MTPALSTIACARVRSASAAARRASQISSANENGNHLGFCRQWMMCMPQGYNERERTYVTNEITVEGKQKKK